MIVHRALRHKIQRIFFHVLWMHVLTGVMYGSTVMKGDPSAQAGQSFSFPIGLQAYHRSAPDGYAAGQRSWFVAATATTNDDTAASYSLAVARPGQSELSPLLTDTLLTVNNVKKQHNPLRGTSFQALDLLGTNPVVARNDAERATLYVLGSSFTPLQMWSVVNTDTTQQPGEIIALAANERAVSNAASNEIVIITDRMTIFTGIRPQGQPFGALGSCIGVNMFVREKSEDDKKEVTDAPLILVFIGYTPLDITSALLTIGGPLTSMEDHIAMHVDTRVGKLFVGVNATSGTNATDGVNAALVRGSSAEDLLMQIVSPALVQDEVIVAARGSEVQVNIYAMRVLHSTTGLPFLLVHGGVGDPTVSIRSIYALPILNQTGQLASVNAAPITQYADNGFPKNRAWVTPPAVPSDLYSSQSIPARVGGGPLSAPINTLFTFGDAVFASTSEVAEGNAPGLWHSQAIFETNGALIAWTPWRRVGGAYAALPLFGFSLDVRSGNFWLITGPSLANATTARKNVWNSSLGVSALATGLFDSSRSGVQGVSDFPMTENRIALSIMTGYAQIVLTQSEQITTGTRAPRTDYSAGYTNTKGTLENFVPGVSWLCCSGGALAQMGAILSAAVVSDDTYSWIVAAGTNGVAVLAHDDGTGWNTNDGLSDGFVGLDATMKWRVVPLLYSGAPLGAIRKLVFESGQLYILANAGLFRIMPSQPLFVEQATPVELTMLFNVQAFASGASASCADCFISGPLAIVASSLGVFRSGTGVDIRTVSGSADVGWNRIVLPYAPGPVGQLAVMGSAQHTNDEGIDANLMVLGSYVGLHQARLYRLVVRHSGVVTDTTVRLFADELALNTPGFFLSVGDYRNGVITNGALLGLSRSRYRTDAPFFEIVAPEWTVWPRSVRLGLIAVQYAYDAVTSPLAMSIYAPVMSNASGSWLVFGDRGLTNNE